VTSGGSPLDSILLFLDFSNNDMSTWQLALVGPRLISSWEDKNEMLQSNIYINIIIVRFLHDGRNQIFVYIFIAFVFIFTNIPLKLFWEKNGNFLT
jgi:hypothetical protein